MSATRRQFLTTAVGGAAVLAVGTQPPAFLRRAAEAAPPPDRGRDTVLVVVQLAGGNDGLNTVVPYEDDAYARGRPTLRLRASQVLKLQDGLGFHPSMPAFHRLYRDGLLAVVQGVGYPSPDPNHPAAMHAWQTADPVSWRGRTGWLGRAVEALAGPMPAAFVGTLEQPFTLHAERAIVPSVRTLADLRRHPLPGASPVAVPAARKTDNQLLDVVSRAAVASAATSARLEAAVETVADYPNLTFARHLRLIAGLIRAEVGVRVFCTELGGQEPGGFDTHAGQATNHGALLEQLTESIAAFARDLRRDGRLDRVLLMTYSEFGRTIQENGRRGTDHGSAAPLFLVGGRLKGGLIGRPPRLDEREAGGVKHHTDFRQVYATALDSWLGLDSAAVLGGRFRPVDALRDAASSGE